MVLIQNELTDVQQQVLLDVAEQGIRSGLTNGEFCDPHPDWYPIELQNMQACFVSLRSGDQLLGSIGTANPQHPLVVDAARNAFEVASAVAHSCQSAELDLNNLQLELTVLSPLHFLTESTFEGVVNQIQAGSEGVFVSCQDCTATFLPSKWEKFVEAREFLRQLCARAGLDTKEWSSGVQVATFTTQCCSRSLDKHLAKPVPH
jgi:AmmeMemoRadiSam system protein A